jgi:hypothetical protein
MGFTNGQKAMDVESLSDAPVSIGLGISVGIACVRGAVNNALAVDHEASQFQPKQAILLMEIKRRL